MQRALDFPKICDEPAFFNAVNNHDSMPLAVFNLKQAGVEHLDGILAFVFFFSVDLRQAKDWYELMPLYVPLAEQQAALAQRLTDKIDSFAALADRRPLLLREQFERDSLQKIAALSQYDEILALRNQIAAQPTDEAVKKHLLSILDEKAELYKVE